MNNFTVYKYTFLGYCPLPQPGKFFDWLIVGMIVFPIRPSGPARVWICKEDVAAIPCWGPQEDLGRVTEFLIMLDEKLQSCIFPELAILALGNQLTARNDVLRFSALDETTEIQQKDALIQKELHARYEEIVVGTMRDCVDRTRPFLVRKTIKKAIWAA